jgi:hypothetical protein
MPSKFNDFFGANPASKRLQWIAKGDPRLRGDLREMMVEAGASVLTQKLRMTAV